MNVSSDAFQFIPYQLSAIVEKSLGEQTTSDYIHSDVDGSISESNAIQ